MVDWLDLLVGGHDIELVCLVSHEGCLAYASRLVSAGEDERRVLERHLAQARRLIAARYPDATVECFVVPRAAGVDGGLGSPERIAL